MTSEEIVPGMTIATREVECQHNDITLEGVLAFEKNLNVSRPAVLVVHGMEGRSEVQLDFAKKLVEWGYVGFAVDLYGKGAVPDNVGKGVVTDSRFNDECRKLMSSLMQNRAMLQDRLLRIVEMVKGLREVETDRLAAVGFCFGGLCVLDLARTGADVQGVASFHGVLSRPGNTAGNEIKAKVIVFHGWEDPLAPPEDLVALGEELTDAGADWQIHAYGKTMHAFMAHGANDPEAGIMYNEVSARRAWASLRAFLREAFNSRVI